MKTNSSSPFRALNWDKQVIWSRKINFSMIQCGDSHNKVSCRLKYCIQWNIAFSRCRMCLQNQWVLVKFHDFSCFCLKMPIYVYCVYNVYLYEVTVNACMPCHAMLCYAILCNEFSQHRSATWGIPWNYINSIDWKRVRAFEWRIWYILSERWRGQRRCVYLLYCFDLTLSMKWNT